MLIGSAMPLSLEAIQALTLGREIVKKLGRRYLSTQHILFGILSVENDFARRIIEFLKVQPETILELLNSIMIEDFESVVEPTPFSPRGKRVVGFAYAAAEDQGSPYVGTEHILLGLIEDEGGVAAQLLGRYSISASAVKNAIKALTENSSLTLYTPSIGSWLDLGPEGATYKTWPLRCDCQEQVLDTASDPLLELQMGQSEANLLIAVLTMLQQPMFGDFWPKNLGFHEVTDR